MAQERRLFGKHVTDQAPGALANGTRVKKCKSARGDSHRDGAEATVRGSLLAAGVIGYFVEWDDVPGVACFIGGHRIKPIGPVKTPLKAVG